MSCRLIGSCSADWCEFRLKIHLGLACFLQHDQDQSQRLSPHVRAVTLKSFLGLRPKPPFPLHLHFAEGEVLLSVDTKALKRSIARDLAGCVGPLYALIVTPARLLCCTKPPSIRCWHVLISTPAWLLRCAKPPSIRCWHYSTSDKGCGRSKPRSKPTSHQARAPIRQ